MANDYAGLIQCYGITQEPNTENYALVLEFMKNGSLRSYLDQNFNSLTWKKNFDIILSITTGLSYIHELNSIHKDLHSGNILQSLMSDEDFETMTYINDFGFCKPTNENSSNSDNKNIYGVMPYMAPEILRGKEYTQKSDVYSLGIIMNEIISIIPPFNKEQHDYHLALDICNGKRPTIREETPGFLKELIQKCWDANPENRPTTEEVYDVLIEYVSDEERDKKLEELEELSYDFTESAQFETHPQAIYTSRLLNFSNLLEQVNCLNQEGFISSNHIMQEQTGKFIAILFI
jgi:serine/threonine protein kinase